MDLLTELEELCAELSPERRAVFEDMVRDKTTKAWIPNPGRQTEAYLSTADIVGYGGAAGGGKTDLLLGSALTQHLKSVIFRRAYVDLRAAEDRLIEMLGSREGYNGQDMVYRSSKRMLEFGALEKPGSQFSWQGRAHDFIGFDEGAQLSVDKVQYVSGWLRSTDAKVKKQVIIATNPPMGGDGAWFFEWFAPWIDPMFADKAAPGDLRWAYNDSLGRPVWVDGPGVTVIAGRNYTHESRTFIPALLEDNPYLVNTDYRAKIENLPEPLRSQLLYGDFMAGRQDHEWQVIPTAWVQAANDRWRVAQKKHRSMIALAMDVAMGGPDSTTVAQLMEDAFFEEIIERTGVSFNDPAMHAALLVQLQRDQADISVDATGGWGTGVCSHLKWHHRIEATGLVFSKKSLHKAKDGKLTFKNLRAEMWWRLREALKPDSGEDVKLPPDPVLMANLTAPRYFVRGTDIVIEDKDEIRKRTGGSVDRGDAVVMAWHRRGASARREQQLVPGLPPIGPYMNRLPSELPPDARDAWMA
jgi:hypothetical protein